RHGVGDGAATGSVRSGNTAPLRMRGRLLEKALRDSSPRVRGEAGRGRHQVTPAAGSPHPNPPPQAGEGASRGGDVAGGRGRISAAGGAQSFRRRRGNFPAQVLQGRGAGRLQAAPDGLSTCESSVSPLPTCAPPCAWSGKNRDRTRSSCPHALAPAAPASRWWPPPT